VLILPPEPLSSKPCASCTGREGMARIGIDLGSVAFSVHPGTRWPLPDPDRPPGVRPSEASIKAVSLPERWVIPPAKCWLTWATARLRVGR
jgi:hypothetical protein